MKNTILELIGKATNKKTVVYDINGKVLPVGDMVEDTFYCWNHNTLGSERNIESWKGYIARNTKVAPVVAPVVIPVVTSVVAPKKYNKTEQKNMLETYCIDKFNVDINKSKKLESLIAEVEGYAVANGSTADEAKELILEVIS